MTERDLVAMICQRPDDVAARKVYADWLLDHGKPLGEIMQLEHAVAEAQGREKARLEKKLEEKWYDRDAWEMPAKALGGNFYYDRGFIIGIQVPVASFVSQPEEVLRWARMELEVDGDATALAAAMDTPALARVTNLTLNPSGWLIRERDAGPAMAALAGSEHARQLRVLRVMGRVTRAEGVERLARSPNLRKLRDLTFDSARAAWVIGALAGRGAKLELESLRLRYSDLENADCAVLGRWAGLRKLRVLELAVTRITDKGAESLLASNHLRRDVRLRLHMARLSPKVRERMIARFGPDVLDV